MVIALLGYQQQQQLAIHLVALSPICFVDTTENQYMGNGFILDGCTIKDYLSTGDHLFAFPCKIRHLAGNSELFTRVNSHSSPGVK